MNSLRALPIVVLAALGMALSASPSSAGPAGRHGYTSCCAEYQHNWGGLYVGGHAGVAYAQTDWTFLTPDERLQQSDTLFAGGAQAGFQHQWARLVAGVEVSYTWMDIDLTSGSAVAADTSLSSTVKNLLLVTGRLGYAYERWLAYAKAGYATADIDFRSGITSTGVVTTTSSDREHGWTAGIGIDMVLTHNISIGVEYDYVRLNVRGREQIATPAGLAGSQIADAGVDLQLFMARLNFKFGRDEPAPAK